MSSSLNNVDDDGDDYDDDDYDRQLQLKWSWICKILCKFCTTESNTNKIRQIIIKALSFFYKFITLSVQIVVLVNRSEIEALFYT